MDQLNHVFIRDDNGVDTLKNLISEGRLKLDNLAVVLLDKIDDSFFKENGIEYAILSDYAKKINLNILNKKVLEFIKTFPHKKILNSKSFVELLDYEGYSLWWFIRQGFYAHCITAMKEIHAIRLLVKERRIKTIIILNQNKESMNVIKESIKNLNVRIANIEPTFQSGKNNFLINKKELILNYLPRAVRVVQGYFRCLQTRSSKTKNNILLVTRSHVWASLSGTIKGDANTYTLLRDLPKSGAYNVIPLDIAINKDAAWKGIKEKKKPFIPYDYFIFKSFFDSNIRKKIKFLRSRLSDLWEKLDRDKILKKTLVCDDVSLYPILRQRIKSYFFSDFDSFLGSARNIEIGKTILDRNNIGATICIDENGTSRFLVFSSRICNVPSIGLQHGVIAPLGSISYNYSKSDLYGYKGNLNCQLTDKTAVFGKYFEKLLMKEGNYPSKNIAITGQPRMDIIFENKKNYSKKLLYKKLGIESGKKLVVYASQPLKEESEMAFSAMIKALKQLKNVRLLVKLHPADEQSLYKDILQELKYEAIISKDIDLYEVLICSDLVISIHSTVILEALALERPVIQLNLLKKRNVFGKEANKVIRQVTKEGDLYSTIKKILYDKSFMEDVNKKRKKFILDYYNNIDGKSTERFINVMRGLVVPLR